MMHVTSSSSSETTLVPEVNDNRSVSGEEGVRRNRSGSADDLVPVQRLSIHEREALILTNLLEQAEAGDAEAQFELADKYYSCPEEERDYKLAQKWFRAAATQNHSRAHLKLGELHFERANYVKAMKHFKGASQFGEVTSRLKIAEMYESGLGVKRSYIQAILWLLKASARNPACYDPVIDQQKTEALHRIEGAIKAQLLQGDDSEKNLLRHARKGSLEAQYLLVWHYRIVLKPKKDLRWLEKIADKTQDPSIYMDLAEIYFKGDCVKQDQKKGMLYLKKAVDLEHVDAYVMFAQILRSKGVLTEAHRYYLLAAERGDREAQSEIGFIYANGVGIPRDLEKALIWIRKSAQQGYAPAQHNLGELYEGDRGIPADLVEARKWYLSAAEQNFAPSMACLAVCFYQGKGGSVDQAEALKYYKLVCEYGLERNSQIEIENVASAHYMVGRMLFAGQGAPMNEAEGLKYIKKSRQLGYQSAHDFLVEKGL
ncbi:MAG: SEL1-like repeat protein [Alphaproteobacteria bacterium]|jgi:TPR repeat protein|nr:SEL1-like repeat protein [Alphaproteobacteria bacterium]